jgi:hypothetical protein
MDDINRTKMMVEDININNELDTLRTIVLNVSEQCNLQCKPCPRAYGYPSSDVFMNIKTIECLNNQLVNYYGKISISGNGEPCLNRNLIEMCKILKDHQLQVITNGLVEFDYETLSQYAEVYVSIHNYDRDINSLNDRFKNIPVIFRNHDTNHPNNELMATNRGGYINSYCYHNKLCNIPFYKVMIDHDGSFLLCPDDWRRITKYSGVDIFNLSIKDYFCYYLYNIKKDIVEKGRQYEPCSSCSIEGTLIGSKFVEWWMKNVYRR